MLAVRRSRTGSMRVMDAKVAAGIRARLSLFGTGSAARESFASEAGFRQDRGATAAMRCH